MVLEAASIATGSIRETHWLTLLLQLLELDLRKKHTHTVTNTSKLYAVIVATH